MPETADIRTLARRVKKLALERAEKILSNPDDPLYNITYETVLKNSVPRTQEITGEDGDPIKVSLVKYADDNITPPVQSPPIPTTTA